MKSRKIIKIICTSLVGMTLITGCNVKPAKKTTNASTKATMAEITQAPPSSNTSVPISTKGSSNSSNSSNTSNSEQVVDIDLPKEGTVSAKALSKYIETLKTLKSDRTVFIWKNNNSGTEIGGKITMDSEYKEGRQEVIYGKEAKLTNLETGESVDTIDWYRTLDKMYVYQDGGYKEQKYDLNDSGVIEVSAVVTKVLSLTEAVEDEKDYVASLEIDNAAVIKDIMSCLGYSRNTKDAWDANLSIEVTIDKETGYLKSINFIAVNKKSKKKDIGEISISKVNEIEKIVLPKAKAN